MRKVMMELEEIIEEKVLKMWNFGSIKFLKIDV